MADAGAALMRRERAEGALRELEEEIGVPEKLVEVLEETPDWLHYEFPPDLKKRLPGPYLGQKRNLFALRCQVGQRCAP